MFCAPINQFEFTARGGVHGSQFREMFEDIGRHVTFVLVLCEGFENLGITLLVFGKQSATGGATLKVVFQNQVF